MEQGSLEHLLQARWERMLPPTRHRNERYIVLQGETLHSVQGDIAFECHSEPAEVGEESGLLRQLEWLCTGRGRCPAADYSWLVES